MKPSKLLMVGDLFDLVYKPHLFRQRREDGPLFGGIHMAAAEYIRDTIGRAEPGGAVSKNNTPLSINLSGVRNVSEEVALILAETDHYLDLYQLEEIGSGEGALALLRKLVMQDEYESEFVFITQHELRFTGIKNLSPEAALIMVESGKELVLGVESVSVEIARILALSKANLTFTRLQSVSSTAVDAFAAYSGNLVFKNDEISESVALLLSKIPGILYIERLKELKNTPAFIALTQKLISQGESLFDDLEVLESEPARLLGKSGTGILSFDSLKSLDRDAAKALSEGVPAHPTILLGGFEEIPETEEHLLLARRLALQDETILIGLRRITPVIARVLSQNTGVLTLSGLEDVSIETLEALQGNYGYGLEISIENLDDKAAEVLSKINRTELFICYCGEVAESVAINLGQFKGEYLSLSGKASMSPKVKEILARFNV